MKAKHNEGAAYLTRRLRGEEAKIPSDKIWSHTMSRYVRFKVGF